MYNSLYITTTAPGAAEPQQDAAPQTWKIQGNFSPSATYLGHQHRIADSTLETTSYGKTTVIRARCLPDRRSKRARGGPVDAGDAQRPANRQRREMRARVDVWKAAYSVVTRSPASSKKKSPAKATQQGRFERGSWNAREGMAEDPSVSRAWREQTETEREYHPRGGEEAALGGAFEERSREGKPLETAVGKEKRSSTSYEFIEVKGTARDACQNKKYTTRNGRPRGQTVAGGHGPRRNAFAGGQAPRKRFGGGRLTRLPQCEDFGNQALSTMTPAVHGSRAQRKTSTSILRHDYFSAASPPRRHPDACPACFCSPSWSSGAWRREELYVAKGSSGRDGVCDRRGSSGFPPAETGWDLYLPSLERARARQGSVLQPCSLSTRTCGRALTFPEVDSSSALTNGPRFKYTLPWQLFCSKRPLRLAESRSCQLDQLLSHRLKAYARNVPPVSRPRNDSQKIHDQVHRPGVCSAAVPTHFALILRCHHPHEPYKTLGHSAIHACEAFGTLPRVPAHRKPKPTFKLGLFST
ncbi:hypothetical protein DFH06DRAFT_1127503 [Mycena polygramma]|nr:hypothetical protein DFH06DRAFT_1127503 [Mycena polygramma]